MRKLVGVVLSLLVLLILLQIARRSSPPAEQLDGQSIVSLAPNLTGLLFELGCGDRVVGVTTYCDYPSETAYIEKIGDFLNPNLEKILSLSPGLVVAERWGTSRTVSRLRALGINVEDFPTPTSLSAIYALIEDVGQLVGREAQASEIVSRMRSRVQAVEDRATSFPVRPKLYLEIDLPSWTVGRASFTNEAIEVCGATNIFSDSQAAAPQVSQEAIIARDPDIIITFISTADEIRNRPGWSRISAVREGRVIDNFEQALLSRGNHRIVEGMEALQSRIIRVMNFREHSQD
jgi:iron complex transport system substrate-binding protein